jgi:hypothetical protein
MKLSIFVLSDPRGGEEALGRLFNALAFAAEADKSGDDVEVLFQGAGTRWPGELKKLDHPARGLYDAVRPLVKGASRGCAAVFGATFDLQACGVPLVADHALPGTPGLGSLRRPLSEGRQTFVF